MRLKTSLFCFAIDFFFFLRDYTPPILGLGEGVNEIYHKSDNVNVSKYSYSIRVKLMKKIILATAIAAFASTAMAADVTNGTVNFKGKVTDQTCSIKTGSENQTVVLKTVSQSVFTATNRTAIPTPFEIKLERCKTTVSANTATKVKAYFSGANIDTTKNYTLKNTAASGAQNVNIQLLNQDGSVITPLKVGAVTGGNGVDDNVKPVTIGNNQDPVLQYKAQYYATGTGTDVTPGEVTSSVDFTIDYE